MIVLAGGLECLGVEVDAGDETTKEMTFGLKAVRFDQLIYIYIIFNIILSKDMRLYKLRIVIQTG